MRIIFMGTPLFAVPPLLALAEAGHEIIAVYTQPPRPGGRRGRELIETPVHQAAIKHGFTVHHPATLKHPQDQVDFAALGADIAIVAAYGLILPPAILAAPKHGCINIHASLLPRWRGAAPVQRAILAGDKKTGISIMQMEAGLDTGPVLAAEETEIGGANAGELTDKLAEIGATLIVRVLSALETFPPVVQPVDGVTYAHKINKAEARLDCSVNAIAVERQIRAFAPQPGAFFEVNGARIKVLSGETSDQSGKAGTVLDDHLTIAAGTGSIRPTCVQRAGRPAMDTAALLRGFPIPVGTQVS